MGPFIQGHSRLQSVGRMQDGSRTALPAVKRFQLACDVSKRVETNISSKRVAPYRTVRAWFFRMS